MSAVYVLVIIVSFAGETWPLATGRVFDTKEQCERVANLAIRYTREHNPALFEGARDDAVTYECVKQ